MKQLTLFLMVLLGLSVGGLGEVRILVPRELVDEARRIIEPRDDEISGR